GPVPAWASARSNRHSPSAANASARTVRADSARFDADAAPDCGCSSGRPGWIRPAIRPSAPPRYAYTAELTDLVDDRGRLAKLRFGQPHVPDKAVQVLDQRHHDFPQAGVGRALH